MGRTHLWVSPVTPENSPQTHWQPPQSWKGLTSCVNLTKGENAHAISPDFWFLVPLHYAIFVPTLQGLRQHERVKSMGGENNGYSKCPPLASPLFVFVFNRWGGEERLGLKIFLFPRSLPCPVLSHSFCELRYQFIFIQAPPCGVSVLSSTTRRGNMAHSLADLSFKAKVVVGNMI